MHILNDFFYCHSIISGYLCLWAWSTTRFRGVLRHLPVLRRQRQPHPHARRDMRPRWVLLCIRRLPLWTPCELPHLLHKGPHTVIISWFLATIQRWLVRLYSLSIFKVCESFKVSCWSKSSSRAPGTRSPATTTATLTPTLAAPENFGMSTNNVPGTLNWK